VSFFEELKRRNVFRVGIAYLLLGWVVLQAADFALDLIDAPNWIIQALFIIGLVGLPFALFFAWAFELTPEGIKREEDVDRSGSITPVTGRKLDRVIILFLALAVTALLLDRFWPERGGRGTRGEAGPVATAPAPEADGSGKPSIAVLPFTTRSTSEEDRFFSDGMHDDLLTQLAKIGSLKVLSRTSVMEYRDTTKNLREIGEELGAAHILEGAVQRAGQQVRINMQLIDAKTDEHLWAETYDRELSVDNLFAIQSEIAVAITEALHATLSPAERDALGRRLTDNLEALEAYRRSRLLSEFFIDKDLELAEMEIRHALKLDPDFAEAWAQLAYVNMAKWWGSRNDPAFRETARDAIERGRAIEPDSAELDKAEGYYHYWGFRDYANALRVLEPALESYPSDAELIRVLAYVNRRYGRLEQALDYLLRALELMPRDRELLFSVGETYSAMRQPEQAQRYLDRLLAIDPTTARGYQLQAALAAARGEFEEAARYAELAAADLRFLLDLTWFYRVAAGDLESALEAARNVAEAGPDVTESQGELLLGLTRVFAGDRERARPQLEEARSQLEAKLEEDPDDFLVLLGLCRVAGAIEDEDATRQYCASALAKIVDDAFDRGRWLVGIAGGLALGGQKEPALDLVESVFELPMGPSRAEVAADPALQSLHAEPRWQRIFGADGSHR
jgi:TolB-like protein